jgi:hypothetical protein
MPERAGSDVISRGNLLVIGCEIESLIGTKKFFQIWFSLWFGQITVLFILRPYPVQAGLVGFFSPISSQSIMVRMWS